MRAALLLTALLLSAPAYAEMTRERCAGWAALEDRLAEFLRSADQTFANSGPPHVYASAVTGEVGAAARKAVEANAQFRAAIQQYRQRVEDLSYQLRVCAR